MIKSCYHFLMISQSHDQQASLGRACARTITIEGSAPTAGGRASASTTAKEAGASNAAARASASPTAKEAASASWLPCVCGVRARVCTSSSRPSPLYGLGLFSSISVLGSGSPSISCTQGGRYPGILQDSSSLDAISSAQAGSGALCDHPHPSFVSACK